MGKFQNIFCNWVEQKLSELCHTNEMESCTAIQLSNAPVDPGFRQTQTSYDGDSTIILASFCILRYVKASDSPGLLMLMLWAVVQASGARCDLPQGRCERIPTLALYPCNVVDGR